MESTRSPPPWDQAPLHLVLCSLLLPCSLLKDAFRTSGSKGALLPHSHRLSLDLLNCSSKQVCLLDVILHTHTAFCLIIVCLPLGWPSVSSGLQCIYPQCPEKCLVPRSCSVQICLINKLMKDHDFKSSSIYKMDSCAD